MDFVISQSCYKGKFYKGIIEKLPLHGHFSIIPLLNFMLKNLGATT